MHTVEITLEQVLLARDRRVQRQQTLHRQYGGTLLSFTMNIAGPVKDTPLVRLAFRAGLAALDRDLGAPVHRESVAAPTGPEALLVYHRPAGAVKDLCLRLEEQAPVGRLYDLDVLSPGGEKLSRPQSRRCLICGGPVTVCSRSRAHGLAAIRAKTEDILRSFAAGHLAQLARQALEDEVCLTPKPGLVDRRNTGAHDDMDLPLFRRSAAALEPYFCRFVSLGMAGASPAELQALGRQAEHAMLTATGGVNTHKGALYSFALLLSALGRSLTEGGDPFHTAAAGLRYPRQRRPGPVRRRPAGGHIRLSHRPAYAGASVPIRCPGGLDLVHVPAGRQHPGLSRRSGGPALCAAGGVGTSCSAGKCSGSGAGGSGRRSHRPASEPRRQCGPVVSGPVSGRRSPRNMAVTHTDKNHPGSCRRHGPG